MQWPAEGIVRFVLISDTHNRESEIDEIPDGDVLLHCGDLTNKGKVEELKSVNDWFATLPHKTKIAIAGNHEIGLDPERYPE